MVRSMIPWRGGVLSPTRTWERLENEMTNVFDRFFGPERGVLTMEESFAPRVNVAETEGEFEVTVELPGIKPEEIKVELTDGQLSISGERSEEKEEKEKTYHRVERHYGSFRRVIPLPEAVDSEKIKAEGRNGILTVTIPKTEQAKPKQIEVKTS